MGRIWTFRVAGTLAVAAMASGVLTAVPQQAQAAVVVGDHVLYWNNILLQAYRDTGGAPGPLSRAGAMMHGAVYDAVNSALCHAGPDKCLGEQYLVKAVPSNGAVPDVPTAVDYAAWNVLTSVYPALSFDTALADAQSSIPASPARTAGISVGTSAAQAMITDRTNDGATDNTAYPVGSNPGDWRPTEAGTSAAGPNWGLVKPFAMVTGSQFRPGPPAGYSTMASLLGSSQYAAQVNEVKALGRATGSTRTADQTQAAWFWANDLDQTYKPPGQLYAHTQILSKLYKLTEAANARLFALVGIAMGDAAITAWDAKYQTAIDLWRPMSAVRLADTDGNSATTKDDLWLPLSADRNNVSFSPQFPAYTSGHATFSAAWAGAMRGFFGTDTQAFTATTEDPHAVGVTRTFSSFSSAATENARSRVYLGVHYQFDADGGGSSGTALANHVNATVVRPSTSAYTFTVYYSAAETCPGPATIEFGIKDAAGYTISDPDAVTGYAGVRVTTQATRPTYNSATGHFTIAAYASTKVTGTFAVLLRDGTRHSFLVDCEVV